MDERPGSLNLGRLVSEGIAPPISQKQSDKERKKSMEI